MSKRRMLRYRYLQTKAALGNTIQQLLEINRRKRLFGSDVLQRDDLAEELKILNATAKNQARVLRSYEHRLNQPEETVL